MVKSDPFIVPQLSSIGIENDSKEKLKRLQCNLIFNNVINIYFISSI